MEINKPATIIIILIVNVMLIFLFVIPKYQESIALEKSLVEKQVAYDSQGEYSIALLKTLKGIEERQDILKKVNSALPGNFSLAPIVYFLQKKAIESQLTVESVTFSGIYEQIPPMGSNKQVPNSSGPPGNDQEIKNIVLMVDVSGSYQGLKNFLHSLERSARIFQVNTISFAPLEFSSPEGLTSAADQIKTYDFKLEIKTQTY